MRRLAVWGLAVVATAGCATKGDVKTLERQVVSEMRQLQADQRALAERIGLAFDSLRIQEGRQLAGRGELQRQFDQLQELLAQILELAAQNNRLLSELRAGRAPGAPGQAAPGPGPPATGPEAAGEDEAGFFYNAALGQYRRGAFETARTGFQDFLQNYPDHRLAPDAQYFLAETYASQEQRDQALRELARVLERWPDSPRAATALYRSGVLEMERGRLADARGFFERVVAGYPNSDEAPLAEEQLRRLRR